MNWIGEITRSHGWVSGLLIATLVAVPAVGQTSNFGTLTLGAEKSSGSLTGSTGGSTSIPTIVGTKDRHNNKCLGFGDPTPDHILILKQDIPVLNLKVNSGGSDTTLIVQGSDGVLRCGDDTSPTNKDASISDTNWRAGTYNIWVGSATPGVRRKYTLTVRQQ
jgi:hypothetical protein